LASSLLATTTSNFDVVSKMRGLRGFEATIVGLVDDSTQVESFKDSIVDICVQRRPLEAHQILAVVRSRAMQDLSSEHATDTSEFDVPNTHHRDPSGSSGRSSSSYVTQMSRVLVVDDSFESRNEICSALWRMSSNKAQVTLAADGDRAVELVESQREQGRPFDLIILKNNNPGSSMSGCETTRKLRSTGFHVGIHSFIFSYLLFSCDKFTLYSRRKVM
jgi:CheY-like chemotaxis protein